MAGSPDQRDSDQYEAHGATEAGIGRATVKAQLAVRDAPNGTMLADWSSRAIACTFSTDEHGYGVLRATVRMSRADRWRWYQRAGALHLELNYAGFRAYEGRIEDIKLTNSGLQIGCFGYWNALGDVAYTALWSDTKLDRWRAANVGEYSGATPGRFSITMQDLIRISPQKNSTQGSGVDGYVVYEAPDQQSRGLYQVSFDYELLAPAAAGTSWRADLHFRDYPAFTSFAGWTLLSNGTGVVQAGSVNTTYTAGVFVPQRLTLRLINTAAQAQYTGETDSTYLKITNLRVLSTTASTVDTDDVAAELAATVAALNLSQLSASTALIQSPGLDLTNEVYEDQYPANILTRLVKLGDNQTPPRQWEVGVYEGQRLYLRPRGSDGRAWYVNAAALELEPSLDNLRNSVYATYQSPTNRNLRSATATDTMSQSRYGVTRQAAVNVQAADLAIATTQRDAYLADHAIIIPRASITLGQPSVQDSAGGIWPAWIVRAGDTVTVRSLPATLASGTDRLRTMRIAGTSYDVFSRRLTLTPESPVPSLETMVARRGEGL